MKTLLLFLFPMLMLGQSDLSSTGLLIPVPPPVVSPPPGAVLVIGSDGKPVWKVPEVLSPAVRIPPGPVQWAGVGVLYNNGVGFNGLGAYAHRLTGNSRPTYSFTMVRITGMEGNPFAPSGGTPFKLLTTQETGLAQYIGVFGPATIFGFTTIGLSQTSNETGIVAGNSLSAGGFASIKIIKGWTANPFISWNKTSLAGNQWAIGSMFGWGR